MTLLIVARPWSPSRLSCGEHLLLRCDGNAGNSFPTTQGKGSLLSSWEAETGLLWMWAGLSCFLSSGDGYVRELLELQQVLSTYDGDLRDPLWWPQERPVPMRVARGPLGIPLPSIPGPKILCGVGAGT